MSKYDIAVIGGGTAGFAAVTRASDNGARTALIESKDLGGECPNNACMPSKIYARAAEIMELLEEAPRLGIAIDHVRFDPRVLLARKTALVKEMTGERLRASLRDRGVDLYKEKAVFKNGNEIEAGGETITADKFIISTGSRPKLPQVPGLDHAGYMTTSDATKLPEMPKSILIIGGGASGMEFARIFNRLGTKTFVVESGDRLLQSEDADISELLGVYAREQGIEVRTTTWVEAAGHNEGIKEVKLRGDHGSEVIDVDEILVAAGRRPNTEGLNLEAAGVGFGPKGIPVDSRMETSAPNIWACGDITGKQLYTNFANYQGDLAGFNATSDQPEEADYKVIPHVVATEPEIASVGMTEHDARHRHADVKVGTMPYKYLGKSLITEEKRGVIKIIVAGNEIIGGHIIGCRAGEIIHEIATAMKSGMTVMELADMVYAYPTYAEGVGAAAADMLSAAGFYIERAA